MDSQKHSWLRWFSWIRRLASACQHTENPRKHDFVDSNQQITWNTADPDDSVESCDWLKLRPVRKYNWLIWFNWLGRLAWVSQYTGNTAGLKYFVYWLKLANSRCTWRNQMIQFNKETDSSKWTHRKPSGLEWFIGVVELEFIVNIADSYSGELGNWFKSVDSTEHYGLRWFCSMTRVSRLSADKKKVDSRDSFKWAESPNTQKTQMADLVHWHWNVGSKPLCEVSRVGYWRLQEAGVWTPDLYLWLTDHRCQSNGMNAVNETYAINKACVVPHRVWRLTAHESHDYHKTHKAFMSWNSRLGVFVHLSFIQSLTLFSLAYIFLNNNYK